MHQFMGAIGRQCSVVNLDPANDHTSYPCALDIRDLVTLEEIMADDNLGPNGGILYAVEELENNMEWLENGLKELGEDYILFDCPGQVELYTHHNSLRNIFLKLQKLGYRVGAELYYLASEGKTTANLRTAGCSTPLRLLLPHAAVLVYLESAPVPPSHAPDGPASRKRPHQDRQDLVL